MATPLQIATRLGYMRSNLDIDAPVDRVFARLTALMNALKKRGET
ncbi:MAG: hypothetical protein WAS23_09080 [Dokdonella sp.]